MRQPQLNLALLCCLLLSFSTLQAHVPSGALVLLSDTLVPPPDVTVSCTDFDPTLLAYGDADVSGITCLDTLYHTTNYSAFDTLCSKGTVQRTFIAIDCAGNSYTAVQQIAVVYQQFYFIHFPNDVIVSACSGYPNFNFGQPEFYGEDCEALAVTYEDEYWEDFSGLSCYRIERSWSIINWCNYDPALPQTYVPNPNPNPIANHPSNLPGPVVSAAGSPAPWTSTVVKINPTDPQPTDYATFWSANANGYRYKQVIRIVDLEAPVIADCPGDSSIFCDQSDNETDLWNNPAFLNPQTGLHDLGEGEANLSLTATDSCSGPNLSISYVLSLDLDNDGVMETVIDSHNPQIPGMVPGAAFDQRNVADSLKYRFALDRIVSGNSLTATLRWDWLLQPINIWDTLLQGVTPRLPYGTHKIQWTVVDGCGNESSCSRVFTVKDCKPPTVVCLNGLSVNIMPTKMVTLWATDFLQYAQDNDTPDNQIKIGIQKSIGSTGAFPLDAQGNPVASVNFTCSELGPQAVQVWAMDAAGNTAFCETYVLVNDNFHNCDSTAGNIKLCIRSCCMPQQNIDEVSLLITSNNPALPPFNSFVQDVGGCGTLNVPGGLPVFTSLSFTPVKDDNPLNGVTTYDLILIQRHILYNSPFTTACQWIAADANKSNSVTAFDIDELRKLILGIYSELPNNTSWRFVYNIDSLPVFPFGQILPEAATITVENGLDTTLNFTGIKIGDVNCSAGLTGGDPPKLETQYLLLPDVPLVAGSTIDIPVEAAQTATWAGYQFFLNCDPTLVKIEGVIPGPGMSMDNFAVFGDGKVGVSWSDGVGHAIPAGARLFSVRVHVLQSSAMQQVVKLSAVGLQPEAYVLDPGRHPLQMLYGLTPFTGNAYTVYAPYPNPGTGVANWVVTLPEASESRIELFDAAGKTVWQKRQELDAGTHVITMPANAQNGSGLYFWRADFPALRGVQSFEGKLIIK